ncbi:MAG: tetratricopeptide repeat protein [Deltaproteobacteria bacterium]|nr:tetratricopeptide repeat protein [Deltaproteobacteria bacterium]
MVKLSCLLLLLLLPTAALADDTGKSEYQAGTRYFEAEEFDAALPLFRIAYERSGKRPATIFALAQCERSLKRYDDAIFHFKEYLATGPDNDVEVRETVELLEELVARNKADQASKEKAAAEAAQKANAEQRAQEDQRQSAERQLQEERSRRQAAEQAAAQERERRMEAEAKTQALPAPVPVPTPALTTTSPPPAEDDSLLQSPVFWIVTAAVVAGGAVAATVALSAGSSPYGGSSGLVLEP